MLKDLIALEPDSRVWVYPASREISYNELDAIRPVIHEFLERWTAHNQSLVTYGNIFHQRFLCLFVDESVAGASGCSIDASVHFIQELGNQLNIDFFDRQQVQFLIDDKVVSYALSEVKKMKDSGAIDENTLFFNNLVKTKKEFIDSWVVSVKDGWLRRFL
jgi:hypothetical protein